MRAMQMAINSLHVSPKEIREQRNRLLESRAFAHAGQLRKTLALMVQHTLLNKDQRVTQALIADAVLKTRDFDPVSDSRVRRMAARLRERLRDYYNGEGQHDIVIITFPKGQPYRLAARRRRSIESTHPLNDPAFEEYQKGRTLWAMRTPKSLHAAMECFKRAINLFPAYSLAFSALGECYFFLAIWGAAPTVVIPEAKRNVLQAIEIDNHNAEAHALLGAIHSAFEWNWKSATREFEMALCLDNNTPGIHCWHASHLISMGNYPEAVHAVRLAQACDLPVSSVLVNAHAAKILLAAGRYEEAGSLFVTLRKADPNFYLSHLHLGILEGIVGDSYHQAINLLQKAANLSHHNSSVLSALGLVYARAGRIADAKRMLSILQQRERKTYVPATELAPLYLALGRSEEAFECLERAFEERCIFLSWLASWPSLKSFSVTPRGKVILQRLHLG